MVKHDDSCLSEAVVKHMGNIGLMKRFVLVLLLAFGSLTRSLSAQTTEEIVWVQIEARPSFSEAVARAETYAQELADVNGFTLSSGWFAIALGPYRREDAEQVLRVYRAERQIPFDSYIATSDTYGQQFWPVGADIFNQGPADTPPAEPAPEAPEDQPLAALPEPDIESPTAEADESPAEARRGEQLLTRAERQALQTALQWAGYYNAAIDGAFGSGTRRSMAAWQRANGYEPTGILTTSQRAALLGQYTAILDGLDMQLVRDAAAGIDIKMPTAEVAFDTYQAPFAQYNATSDLGARVLLISQMGDRTTLSSLYEIMQTLEIVPLEGPRSLRGDSFTLVGRNAKIVSETRVSLAGGRIKGFTLIWPAGDEERRRRVIDEMEASFVRQSAVLDADAGVTEAQQIDLVSGLQVRKPLMSRSGFYVDTSGAVVTTADAVQSCTRITLDEVYDATLSGVDPTNGIAILKPTERLAPPDFARFSPNVPRLQSQVAVAGYSFEGQLNAASVTFGTLSALKGLSGEANMSRLAVDALPGDAGGPVFDEGGNVMGMLLPRPSGTRQLPDEVRFALSGEAIAGVLAEAGVVAQQGERTASLAPEDITARGVGMTVLVSCWE